VHIRAEGGGKPLVFVLSGGERHESLFLGALLTQVQVRRAGPGYPRVRPGQLVADKGYSCLAVRRTLARRGIRAVIPHRRDQRPDHRRYRPLDRAVYRDRNRIERLINRMKQCRRLATRYEKRASHVLAMLTLAACLLWT
jgi:transposase